MFEPKYVTAEKMAELFTAIAKENPKTKVYVDSDDYGLQSIMEIILHKFDDEPNPCVCISVIEPCEEKNYEGYPIDNEYNSVDLLRMKNFRNSVNWKNFIRVFNKQRK